ncbi:olfactory receptor 52E4-like [Rhinatrema bivittatum]|uniref:olfactory receptor 52E4-like n=1 Tax=Rhinatrema bivittatum TaxID=194408 RepID=UPI0011295A31|nr:olfactory receptor 52E4-like [Rhinatrema bivittatum]
MSTSNTTISHPATFILSGIPGLDSSQFWLAIPFCTVYILSLLGNITLLFIIRTESSLHTPMYIFLSLLAMNDIIVPTSSIPTMLGIYWFNAQEITFNACLAQMYFVHTFSGFESGILSAMAIDRYIAICHPLRYTTILTNSRIAKIGVVIALRPIGILMPHPFLLNRLSYCKTNVIPHSYCEFMAVAQLSCSDLTVTSAYGLTVVTLVLGLDVILITLSYIMILKTILNLPSTGKRLKAFSTCGSHVCVILLSYSPALFSFLMLRFAKNAPKYIQPILANVYLFCPPMLNPFVYGVRTKQIRKKVLCIMRWKKFKDETPREL